VTHTSISDAVAAYAWPPPRTRTRVRRVPARVPANWNPSLSPDANRVVFVSDRGGAPRAYVQKVGGEEQHQLETGGEPVIEVSWSPSGEWIACVLAPGGSPRHEVWLIRPDGSELHLAAGAHHGCAFLCGWAATSGRLMVTQAGGAHDGNCAFLLDPLSGERTELGCAQMLLLRDVSPDERASIVRLGPRSARWLELRSPNGVPHDVLGGPAAGSRDLGHFSPDGRIVYLRSDVDRNLAALVAVNVATGEQHVVAERGDAELESFAISPDRRVMVLLWNLYGGRSEVTLYEPAHARRRSLPAPPGEVFSGLSLSYDGGWLALTSEGPSQPKNVWLVNVHGESVVPMTYTPPQLTPKKTTTPELHRFAAADGLGLSGWLYRTPQRPAGTEPGPVVLHLHGGPEAQDRPTFSALYSNLVARGMSVFAPNVRGSSGFGREFVNADNVERRYAAITDVKACVDYLITHDIADPDRIGCMGRSYGGYLTLAALVEYPELFAVGVDTCGMSNLLSFYERTEPWIALEAVSKYGDPERDRELLRDLSPLFKLDRLAAPLLVVHGAHDTNVPLHEAEQLVRELAARNLRGGFLLFPDEGHDLLFQHNRAKYIRVVGDWLADYLLTDKPRKSAHDDHKSVPPLEMSTPK
jgi:dipeptidyl aminopeptidase/acylaminoacyl peptidase